MRISDWSSDVCSSDLDLQGARSVAVDLGACSAVDSAGAWVLERTFEDLRRQGAEVSLINCPPAIETLLGTVAREHCELPPAPKAENPLLAVTIRIGRRSEEHTSELQSLMSTSYAVFCLKKKKQPQ